MTTEPLANTGTKGGRIRVMRSMCIALAFALVTGCQQAGKRGEEPLLGAAGEAAEQAATETASAAADVSFAVDWSTQVGDNDQPGIRLIPAVAEGFVYVPTADGTVASLRVEDGKVEWQQRLDESLSAGIGAGSGKLVVASREGRLYGLDARSGETLWRYPVFSEVLAAPVIDGDVVVGRSVDGKVFGIDADSGAPIWAFQRDVPSLTLRGASRTLLFEGVAVNGFANGNVVANETDDGAILWELPVADARGRNEIERLIDLVANPVMLGSVLYVAVYRGQLTALAMGSRRVLWQQDISSRRDIAVDTNHVYVTDDDQVVQAVDRLTGELVWKQTGLSGDEAPGALSGPVLFAGELLVADDDGNVHVLDAVTGRMLDTLALSGDIANGGMLVDGDRAFTLSRSGRVTALRIEPD